MKKHLLMFALLFIACFGLFAATVSNTYTDGDIETEYGFDLTSETSSCPGQMTVTVPAGVTITGVDVSYSMTAASGGYRSEQRSQLRCITSGEDEPAIYSGSGTGGTYSYERTGLTIANGIDTDATQDILFELHAGRTWGGSGCSSNYNKVDNETWTITISYLSADAPGMPSNPSPADLATMVNYESGDLTWEFGDNVATYSLWFGPEGNMTMVDTAAVDTSVTPTYSYTDLDPYATYQWQVKSYNAARLAAEGPVWSFTTIYSELYRESFDDYAGNGWIEGKGRIGEDDVVTETSCNWGAATDFANVSTPADPCAYVNLYRDSENDWIISPSIDVSSLPLAELVFDIAHTDYNSTAAEAMTNTDTFAVAIFTDGLNLSTASILQVWDATTEDISNTGETDTLDISEFISNGSVRVGFYVSQSANGTDTDFFVDDVKIQEKETPNDDNDIAVRSLEAIEPAATGDLLSVGVNIMNIGANAQTGDVDFYYQLNSETPVSQTFTMAMPNFGDAQLVTFNDGAALVPGEHTLTVWHTNAGDENTFNDTITTTFTVDAAKDLAITALVSPVAPITMGDTLTVTVTLQNNAAVDASGFLNCYYKINDGTAVSGFLPVPGLVPGATQDYSFATKWIPDAGGAADLTVWLSYAGDEDTSNDTLTQTYDVLIPDDIGMTNVALDVPTPITGGTYTIQSTVENMGSGAQDSVSVTCYYQVDEGTPVSESFVLNLAGLGSTQVVEFTEQWTPSVIGDYTITTWTELAGDVLAGNDEASAVFTVEPANDLGVTDITLSSDALVTTDTYTVSATVTNIGYADQDSVTVTCYYQVNDGTPVSEDFVIDLTGHNDTQIIEFTELWAPATSDSAYVTAWTDLTGDEVAANDEFVLDDLYVWWMLIGFDLHVTSGEYSGEHSWYIRDADGNILESKTSSFTDFTDYDYHFDWVPGTYRFEAVDSWGDGWNGGWYSITVSNGTGKGHTDVLNDGDSCNFVLVNPNGVDMQTDAYLSSDWSFSERDYTISTTFKNVGMVGVDDNVTCYYQINDNAPVSQSFAMDLPNIFDTLSVDFTTPWTTQDVEAGWNTVKIWTDLPGDEEAGNDTLTTQVWVYDPIDASTEEYTEDFEGDLGDWFVVHSSFGFVEITEDEGHEVTRTASAKFYSEFNYNNATSSITIAVVPAGHTNLKFWYKDDGTSENTDLTIDVYDGEWHEAIWQAPATITSDWTEGETYLSGLYDTSNPILIRFNGNGYQVSNNQSNLYLDDIYIYDVPLGSMEGTITKAGTSTPIEGAIVSFPGFADTTDVNGEYSIIDIPESYVDVQIEAVGYATKTVQDVRVRANMPTNLSVALDYADIAVAPNTINVTTNPLVSVDSVFTITNNGTSALGYNIYSYDYANVVRQNVTLQTAPRTRLEMGVQPITVSEDTWGYVSNVPGESRNTGWHTYAPVEELDGCWLDGPVNAVRFNMTDFTNTSFPVTVTQVMAYFYDPAIPDTTGTVEAWADSTFQYKIYASDGQTLLYESPMLEAAHATPIVHQLPEPITFNTYFYIAVDPVDESNAPYVLGDQDSNGNSVFGEPGSWTSINSLDLAISAYLDDQPWMSVSPTTGTIAPGESNDITVTLNPWDESDVVHTGYLSIAHNGLSLDPEVVNATLTVTAPIADPDTLGNMSPADGAVDVALDASLSWTQGGYIDSTEVFFGPVGSVVKVATYFDGETTWTPEEELAYNTTYEWRVENHNTYATRGTVIGGPVTFTTIDAVAENPVPADGAINISLTQNLDWDNVAFADSFNVWFGATSGALDDYGFTTTSGFALSDTIMANGTEYFWKVDTYKDDVLVGTTEEFSFTTITEAPMAPLAVAPVDDAVDVGLMPRLDWECTNADTFYVYFKTLAAAEFTVLDTVTNVTYYDIDEALELNTEYLWKIEAHNVAGNTMSGEFSFTTLNPVVLNIPFTEDFEGDVSGWTMGESSTSNDIVSWEIGEPQGLGYTSSTVYADPTEDHSAEGTKCAGTDLTDDGDYESYEESWLESPYLALPADTGMTLTFWRWLNIYSSYDYVYVEVSTDYGTTWQDLGHPTWVKENEWTEVSFNLSEYAGNDVKIRWRIDASSYGEAGGWNIDDVSVDYIVAPLVAINPDPVPDTTGVSLSKTLSWTNQGIVDSTIVWFGEAGSMAVYDTVTASSISMSGLTHGTEYEWKIVNYNVAGDNSATAPTWAFTTITGVASELVPVDGATNVLTTATNFDWAYISGIDSFMVSVGTEPGVYDTTAVVTVSGYNMGGTFEFDQTYYWKVDSYADDVMVGTTGEVSFTTIQALPLTPTLVAPTDGAVDVSIVTNLEWECANADSFVVYFAESGQTMEIIDTVTTTSVTVENLALNTTYQWSVVAGNEAGTTNSGTFTFTTINPTVASFPFAEDFEGDVSLWQIAGADTVNSWEIGEPQGLGYASSRALAMARSAKAGDRVDYFADPTEDHSATGTKCAGTDLTDDGDYQNYENSWIISPLIPLPSGVGVNLTFWRYLNVENNCDEVYVEVSDDFGVTWNDLGHSSYAQDSEWTEVSLNLTAYAGSNVYIRWRLDTDLSVLRSGWNIDDVSVDVLGAPSAAINPTPVADTTGVDLSTTLSWTNQGIVDSTVVYFAPSDAALVPVDTVTTTTYNATGLEFNTTYNWKVVNYNASGNTEATAATWAFTTLYPAVTSPVPANGAENVAIDATELSWTGNSYADSFKVYFVEGEYVDQWDTTATQTGTTFTPAVEFANNTLYTWKVETWIDSVMEATATFTFTTVTALPVQAYNPTPAHQATDVTIDAQTLTWESANADSFFVTLNAAAARTPIVSEFVYTNSIDIPALELGATYTWQVDAWNGAGSTAGNPWTFATISELPMGDTPANPFVIDFTTLAFNDTLNRADFHDGVDMPYTDGMDIVYQLTLTESTVLDISLLNSTFDTYLAVYSNSVTPGADNYLFYNDNYYGSRVDQSFLSGITLDAGTYYIVVDGYSNEAGTMVLEILANGFVFAANLSVEISGTDVVLDWDAYDGADSYDVYASDDPYTWGAVLTNKTVTSHTIDITTLGNKKFFKVVAKKGSQIMVRSLDSEIDTDSGILQQKRELKK